MCLLVRGEVKARRQFPNAKREAFRGTYHMFLGEKNIFLLGWEGEGTGLQP